MAQNHVMAALLCGSLLAGCGPVASAGSDASDAGTRDAHAGDTATPDVVTDDAVELDVTADDTAQVDASTADTSSVDDRADDVAMRDAGRHDAATPDAGAGDGGGPIVFGMFTDTAIAPAAEGSTSANWRAIADRYFPENNYHVRRSFDTGLPSSFASSAAAQDPAHGIVSFLSVKPPGGDHAGVAAGTYDAAIRSLAASIPAGSYFTMYHEPEDNMTGAQFVAMFRHFYMVAKAANPHLTIGYVAGSYQWRPGSPSTVDEDAWYPGDDATDFLGVDTYDTAHEGEHALDTQSDFQRWYQWAMTKSKPLLISEFGIENALTGGFPDADIASLITRSVAWAQAQPRIGMILYWDGTSANPGGKSHILNPTTSSPTDAFPLARAAWNAAVHTYGSSGTSLR